MGLFPFIVSEEIVRLYFFWNYNVINSMICVFADLFSSSFRPVYDGAVLFRVETAYHNSGILG
jgi:hypothetical protein